AGNLYVADSKNHMIRRVVVASGTVNTITTSFAWSGGAARFNHPSGVTTDGVNLYLTDSSNHTIRKVVIDTGAVTTLAGSAGFAGATDGTGTAATFRTPAGMTTDGQNLYVVDSGNLSIRRMD